MKRLINIVLIVGMLTSFGPAAANPAQGSAFSLPADQAFRLKSQNELGMPGWPSPDKPIPHHEPGQPARGGEATYQVTRPNTQGVDETFELTGLDAMLADGTMSDPLQGNYRLVGLDKFMFSSYTRDTHIFSVQSFKFVTPTLGLITDTTVTYGNMRFNAIATGDLNGDLVDEQIAAWVNPNDELIRIAIGELPGSFGKTTSAPGVFAHTDGSLDIVVRGYDQAFWHTHSYSGSSWGGWNNDAGGLLLSNPAVASRAANELDVLAVGVDNQVYHTQWISPTWNAWTLVDCGGSFPEIERVVPLPEIPAPAVVARGGDQLDLFRRGPDNTLYWCHSSDGVTWGSWQNLGGMLASPPGAVSLGSESMQVYTLGMDGALWYRTYDTVWGAWLRFETPDGVAGNAFPVLASPPTGGVNVYLAGTENRVWWIHHDGTAWGGWSSIDVVGGELGVGISASGAYLFAQMSDGSLQYTLNASSWTSLAGLPTSQVETTTAAQTKSLQGVDVEEYDNPILDITTGYFSGDGRQQIVLAYDGANENLRLEIYDIHDGFLLTKTAELTSTFSAGWPRVTAGDVDGDGVDEIGLVYVQDTAKYIELRVYRIEKDSNSHWTLTQMYDSGIVYLDNYDFAGTLRIAAGDIVTETNPLSNADEFAVVWDGRHNDGSRKQLEFKLHLYDHKNTGDSFTVIKNGFTEATGSEENPYMSATGIGLAVGDVVPDTQYGTDEIVVIWPREFSSNIYARLRVDLKVLSRNSTGGFNETTYQFPCYSNHSALDTLAIGDLDQDLENEIVVVEHGEGCTSSGFHLDVFESKSLSSGPVTSYSLSYGAIPRAFNLAMGDFTGESIRVGPPTYRVQNQMTTPVVFLNLPPMHRDIIKINGVDQVIKVTNNATAQHIGESTGKEVYSEESKREWDLSTGFEMGVGGGGHKVKTSLTNTYGENFSTSITGIKENSVTDQTTADSYDQVIYNGTDYAVWEYPVYRVQDGNPGAKTISVVWPLVNNTNTPNTRIGAWCDENFYTPAHQTYNIWSYDPIALGDDGFEDMGVIILSKQTTGGSETTLRMSDNSGVSRSASYHNQISAGLEYSYESELNIPLIGKAWDFSFRAYANGSYKHENLSTFSSETTEATGVKVAYPGYPNSNIKIYMYWAKAGYLVLDYQTDPEVDASSWSLYTKPDPAFILPWYGFPDPSNPEPPPCTGKQLFTHDIQFDPGYVQNGDTVTMTATVRNFSPQPLANVTVWFYLGYPSPSNDVAHCNIAGLNRINGPKQCSATWVVTGAAGEEKIYAVIDPNNVVNEMHDEGDTINNNIGYGLLNVASADYFDPGLRQAQMYQAVLYEGAPGLGFGLYLPTANVTETVRYELVPAPSIGGINIVGSPLQVLAFRGGQKDPENPHNFGSIPAGMMALYRDVDLLPGMVEDNLKLYRLEGATWVEATCPVYDIVRFLSDKRLAVPICQTGIFVLSDRSPLPPWNEIYLPLISR